MNYVALDIETDGLNVVKSKIIGIGLYSSKGASYIANPTKQDVEKIVERLNGRGLVAHNAVFDLATIYHSFKIDLTEHLMHDTMLMQHLFDEEHGLSLDALAKHYLNDTKQIEPLKESVIRNGGKWLKDTKEMFKADPEILREYCLHDCKLTYELCKILEKRIQEEGLQELYDLEVMPMYKLVTIPMKYKGIYIDVPYFRQFCKELTAEVAELEEKTYDLIRPHIKEAEEAILDEGIAMSRASHYGKKAREMFGDLEELTREEELQVKKKVWQEKTKSKYIFNLRSTQQLRWLLQKMKVRLKKKTDKGALSVDSEVLEENAHLPFVASLLAKRKAEKMLVTYVEPMLEKNVKGVMYPDFHQAGTPTGRYRCSNPNFMNLPTGDSRIKKGVIAPEGYKIVTADASALEPRAFSETSGCTKLIEAFKNGEDLYSRMAIDMYGLTASAVKGTPDFLGTLYPEIRQRMKVAALAGVYGAGAMQLSKNLGISKDEAQKFLTMYFKAYPDLKAYMLKQYKTLISTGKIISRFGRIKNMEEALKLKELTTREAQGKLKHLSNTANNHPIQSLGAHVVNAAMIELTQEIRKRGLDAWIFLQIHDSISLYARIGQEQEVAELLNYYMCNNRITRQLETPFTTELQILDSLEKAH